MIRETEIEIATPDGTADGFLYAAEGGKRPGVLYLTDIRGVREAFRDMARRVAEQGYTVLLPNVFYRTRRPPVFDFPMKFGEERTMKRFGELTGPMTPEAMERDGGAYADFLAGQDGTSDGAIAVVGHCFTGAMALRTAAARPERIAAAASFHGGRLFTDDDASPHLVLPRVKARLYFGHADNDQSMPAEAIEKLGHALASWGGSYESEVYDGAGHGWTVPGAQVYNREQAERAFAKLIELLSAAIP